MVDTGEHVVFDDETFAGGESYGGEALYGSETTDGKRQNNGVMGQFFKRIRHHAAQLHSYLTHLIAAKKDLGSLLMAGASLSFGIGPNYAATD